MFELNSKWMTKIVFLVPSLVLAVACSSKQVQNASLEPLDLPVEESVAAPESEMAAFSEQTPAMAAKKAKPSRKTKLARRVPRQKKTTEITSMATVQEKAPSQDPVIGDDSLVTAPIAMEPMAPPVPFDTNLHNGSDQPNWLLAALGVGGLVVLIGVAFRVRRQVVNRKRHLIYNA